MILFILILAAVILGGSYFSYRIAFHSPKELRGKSPSVKAPQYDPYRPRMRELFKAFSERPCEMVTIQSHDGLKLSARYYHTADGAPLDICCHGYKSHPITDFSGGSQQLFLLFPGKFFACVQGEIFHGLPVQAQLGAIGKGDPIAACPVRGSFQGINPHRRNRRR